MTDRGGTPPPYPEGWFCVGLARQLRAGQIRTIQFLGQELVLFRTEMGRVAAADAFCPHLGAHLGHGGVVQGEAIRCPFHGFTYGTDGSCLTTPYGAPPPRCRLQAWPIRETDGLLFVYHHPAGHAPAWNIPSYLTDGWPPYEWFQYDIKGHVLDIMENAIDLGHFVVLHELEARLTTALSIREEDRHLTLGYDVRRTVNIGFSARKFDVHYMVHIHGLGFILADTTLPELGLRLRNLVLPRPTAAGRLLFQGAVSIQKFDPRRMNLPHRIAGWLPGRLVDWLLMKTSMHGIRTEIAKDLPIWANKTYRENPVLVQGDGPIMQFRRWAQQFYDGGPQACG